MKCHPDLVEYMIICDYPLMDDVDEMDYVLALFADHQPRVASEFVIYVYGWFKPIFEKYILLDRNKWGLFTDVWDESIIL